MLKRILKVITFVLLGIAAVAMVFVVKASISMQRDREKKYGVALQSLTVPYGDSAALVTGKRLAVVKGCVECHGADLGGKILHDDFFLGRIVSSNLTKGKGGLPSDFDADDWVRSIKHSLRADSTSLRFMPSKEFSQMSEADVAALVAYCSQVPLVDRELPPTRMGPLLMVLSDVGKLTVYTAKEVDHTLRLAVGIKPGVSVEYGKYLSVSCAGCHRENMKGGEPLAPGFPPIPDITSTGNVGKWDEETFMQTLRTGVTPEGKVLDPKNMPWPMAAGMSDDELKALRLYLNSL